MEHGADQRERSESVDEVRVGLGRIARVHPGSMRGAPEPLKAAS